MSRRCLILPDDSEYNPVEKLFCYSCSCFYSTTSTVAKSSGLNCYHPKTNRCLSVYSANIWRQNTHTLSQTQLTIQSFLLFFFLVCSLAVGLSRGQRLTVSVLVSPQRRSLTPSQRAGHCSTRYCKNWTVKDLQPESGAEVKITLMCGKIPGSILY